MVEAKIKKRRVILVTDGDVVASRTIEEAAKNIGARLITLSTGNPTPLNGEQIVELIKKTPHDPVVVMLDDKGACGFGKGEQALEIIAGHPDIEVLGAVAVASNTPGTEGVPVNCSVTREGQLIDGPVNKDGEPLAAKKTLLEGDTVDILSSLNIPIIVGTGDTGKMDKADDIARGAPITTKAFQEILHRSGFNYE